MLKSFQIGKILKFNFEKTSILNTSFDFGSHCWKTINLITSWFSFFDRESISRKKILQVFFLMSFQVRNSIMK